jgi:hypothetical protein
MSIFTSDEGFTFARANPDSSLPERKFGHQRFTLLFREQRRGQCTHNPKM